MTTTGKPVASRTAGRRRVVMLVTILGAALLLTSCAATHNPAVAAPEAAGFWSGLWHGLICPITFIISLFNDHVAVYAVPNNGHLYDFGFILGILIGASIFRGPTYINRRRDRARA